MRHCPSPGFRPANFFISYLPDLLYVIRVLRKDVKKSGENAEKPCVSPPDAGHRDPSAAREELSLASSLAGCGKTSISTASTKTTRLSSLMEVACYRRILRRIVELRQQCVGRRILPLPAYRLSDRVLNRHRLLVPKLVANTQRTCYPVLRGVAGF